MTYVRSASSRYVLAAVLAGLAGSGCADDPVGLGEAVAVEVSAAEGTLLYLDTLRLSASVRDAAENNLPSAGVTWSTSNPDVAVVSATGLVTAVWPGQVTIRAQSGALVDSVPLIVDTNYNKHRAGNSDRRCDILLPLPWRDHGFQFAHVDGGTLWNAESPVFTYFHDVYLFYNASVMFGTDPDNMVVSWNSLRSFQDLGRAGVCRVPEIHAWHTVSLVQSPGLDTNPVVAIPRLTVIQETFAFPQVPQNDYVLVRYTFTNGGEESITALRFGVIADFMLGSGRWNESIGAAEVVSAGSAGESVIGGFKLIGVETDSYRTTFPVGPSNRTRADYFSYLATSDGTDSTTGQLQLLSAAPVDILPGESKSIWYAVAGGLTRPAFEANIARAAAAAEFLEPISH